MRQARSLVLTVVAALAVGLAGCSSQPPGNSASASEQQPEPQEELTPITVTLGWLAQGEYAGHYVAKNKGFYEEVGLDVTIQPGGPDVSLTKLLATGATDFGVMSATDVLLARAQGMTIKGIWAQNQDSGFVWMCKASTGIKGWQDLAGHTVGSWGGPTDPTLAYLIRLAGVDPDDVEIVPQNFSIAEWLQGKVDCAAAAMWNELQVAYREGLGPDDLVILQASDLDKMYPGDGGAATEQMIQENPDLVQDFVTATLRGWQFAIQNPEEAADLLLKDVPDLVREEQVTQVEVMAELLTIGAAAESGKLGFQGATNWEAAQTILVAAGELEEGDVTKAFTNQFVEGAPAEYTALP